jgi:membrane protease YdiL (CAAX protease family)
MGGREHLDRPAEVFELSTAENAGAICATGAGQKSEARRAWDLFEVVFGYVLILTVIWTPRPLQRWLYWAALGWFVFSVILSFPGWRALGCCVSGFRRSVWVVGVALGMAAGATAVASSLHTLHHPARPIEWVLAFGGYTVWALIQQMLLQGYFLARFVRLLPSATWAAIAAAMIFALAHQPNPILTAATLLWGLAACLIFLKWRNIWPLAMAHAIFGISIAITIPGPVSHNMRVGLGYLRYHPPAPALHLSQRDHTVSTVAWVRDEAPTRR